MCLASFCMLSCFLVSLHAAPCTLCPARCALHAVPCTSFCATFVWVESSAQCLPAWNSLLLVLPPTTSAIVMCSILPACKYCTSMRHCCCDLASCAVQLSIQFSQTFEGTSGMLSPAAGPGLKMCTSMTMASFVYVLWVRSHAFQQSSKLQHMYC